MNKIKIPSKRQVARWIKQKRQNKLEWFKNHPVIRE